MNIVVLYSIPTRRSERAGSAQTDADTKESAEEIAAAILARKAHVRLHALSEDTVDSVRTLHPDLVVNLVEWTGFDLPLSLHVFDWLESAEIPFTGAPRRAFVENCDKIAMKRLMDAHGIPTPPWQAFETGKEPIRPDLAYPVIVKLAFEHCGIGLTRDAVVQTPGALGEKIRQRISSFGQPVYVESFIRGREFQVTVLEKDGKPIILPIAEMQFTGGGDVEFLTYEGKWDEKHPDYQSSRAVVALLDAAVSEKMERIVLGVYQSMHFADYARFDLRMGEDKNMYVLEGNANPGLFDFDDLAITVSFKAAGFTFTDVVWMIIDSALFRFSHARTC